MIKIAEFIGKWTIWVFKFVVELPNVRDRKVRVSFQVPCQLVKQDKESSKTLVLNLEKKVLLSHVPDLNHKYDISASITPHHLRLTATISQIVYVTSNHQYMVKCEPIFLEYTNLSELILIGKSIPLESDKNLFLKYLAEEAFDLIESKILTWGPETRSSILKTKLETFALLS